MTNRTRLSKLEKIAARTARAVVRPADELHSQILVNLEAIARGENLPEADPPADPGAIALIQARLNKLVGDKQ